MGTPTEYILRIPHKLPHHGSWAGEDRAEGITALLSSKSRDRPSVNIARQGISQWGDAFHDSTWGGGAGPSHPPGAAVGLETLCSPAS